MRVVIDCRPADGPLSGITWYTRTLLGALAACPDENRYLLLRQPESQGRLLPDDGRFEERTVPDADDRWLEFNLQSQVEDWNPDLYHSPLAPVPVVRSCPGVMTVHDLIPRLFPEFTDAGFARYFRERLVPGFRRCERLLAVSKQTARDLTNFYGIAPDRISVVPEAAPIEHSTPMTAEAAAPILSHLRVRRPYLLAVGAIEPRKNVGRLLDAYLSLSEPLRQKTQLVVIGAARDRGDKLAARLGREAEAGQVRWLETASPRELRACYSQARALVFVSCYEGFGLPVVEALAHGLPVIVSQVSSLPEVAGYAGLLVDPYDPAAIAAAMRRLIAEEAAHATFAQLAGYRSRGFSLAGMGAATLAAYRRAIAETGGEGNAG